ncbi:MAG: hypothetical protein JWP00_4460 [Chloroflexi bacterium]|jgi:hypothetical protein|nr:hypothetical protein [Chloroflexota bacterium]
MERLEALVERVMVSRDPHRPESTACDQATVTFEGFEGDKHSGLTRLSDARTPHIKRRTVIRNSRQVSLVSVEELAEIAAALDLPLVEPEWLGANLLLSGIPNLTYLPPSTRLFFPGNAVLVVEGENDPCLTPGDVLQSRYLDKKKLAGRFPKAALHRRGLVGWVERPGLIKPGEPVRVEVPSQVLYSFPKIGAK